MLNCPEELNAVCIHYNNPTCSRPLQWILILTFCLFHQVYRIFTNCHLQNLKKEN